MKKLETRNQLKKGDYLWGNPLTSGIKTFGVITSIYGKPITPDDFSGCYMLPLSSFDSDFREKRKKQVSMNMEYWDIERLDLYILTKEEAELKMLIS